MAKIQHLLDKIRTAIYGKEVRGSLADGLEAINKETEDATEVAGNVEQRQDTVEQQFDDVLAGYSEDRPISNEETIAARTNRNTNENYGTIGQRLDAENKKVNAQLADVMNKKVDRVELSIFEQRVKIDVISFKNSVNVDFQACLIELEALRSIINANYANSISDGASTFLAE